MPNKHGKTNRKKAKKKPRRFAPRPPSETRTSEVLTVAWTVSLTMVLACDVVAVIAHLYAKSVTPSDGIELFVGMMLFGGSVVGVVCLGLLPVLIRVRRLPPPPGIMVFGVLVSVAPMLAAVARVMQGGGD
jgi:hypothetical protein